MLSEQKIKNMIIEKSKDYHIPVDQMYSLYGLEQLLKKLSQSQYKENLVLKGGFLLVTRYGLEKRTTKDLDTTVREMILTEGKMTEIIDYITAPNEAGQQVFSLISKRPIRKASDFQGYGLKLYFHIGKIKMKLDLDMTCGEDLLPFDEQEKIPLVFEEGTIEFSTYTVEQILADKIYTTAAYGAIDDTNTRSKDLYDIYFLTRKNKNIDYHKLLKAVHQTSKQRRNALDIVSYPKIIEKLSQSKKQQDFWRRYTENYDFAKDLQFATVMESVKELAEQLILKEG